MGASAVRRPAQLDRPRHPRGRGSADHRRSLARTIARRRRVHARLGLHRASEGAAGQADRLAAASEAFHGRLEPKGYRRGARHRDLPASQRSSSSQQVPVCASRRPRHSRAVADSAHRPRPGGALRVGGMASGPGNPGMPEPRKISAAQLSPRPSSTQSRRSPASSCPASIPNTSRQAPAPGFAMSPAACASAGEGTRVFCCGRCSTSPHGPNDQPRAAGRVHGAAISLKP